MDNFAIILVSCCLPGHISLLGWLANLVGWSVWLVPSKGGTFKVTLMFELAKGNTSIKLKKNEVTHGLRYVILQRVIVALCMVTCAFPRPLAYKDSRSIYSVTSGRTLQEQGSRGTWLGKGWVTEVGRQTYWGRMTSLQGLLCLCNWHISRSIWLWAVAQPNVVTYGRP